MTERLDYSKIEFTKADLAEVEIEVDGAVLDPLPEGKIVEDIYGEVPRNNTPVSETAIEDLFGEVVFVATPDSVNSDSSILSNCGSLDYSIAEKIVQAPATKKVRVSREEFGDY